MIKVAKSSKFKLAPTCYNLDGYVGGRGCSTKHQKFSTSCENHIIGGLGEERSENRQGLADSYRLGYFVSEFATAATACAIPQM